MKGQDFGVEVDYEKISEIKRLYEVKFDEIFGYFPNQERIQVYSLRFHFASPEPTTEAEEFTDPQNTIPKERSEDTLMPSSLFKVSCMFLLPEN